MFEENQSFAETDSKTSYDIVPIILERGLPIVLCLSGVSEGLLLPDQVWEPQNQSYFSKRVQHMNYGAHNHIVVLKSVVWPPMGHRVPPPFHRWCSFSAAIFSFVGCVLVSEQERPLPC